MTYAFTDRPQVDESPMIDIITGLPMPGARSTVTFEVDAADAEWIRVALADSAMKWHDLSCDASQGRRADLDAESCLSISRRAWRLWRELTLQEQRQV